MTECPRCSGPVVRNHDEVVCLRSCGTVAGPVRAWDAVEVPAPQATVAVAGRSGRLYSAAEEAWLMASKDTLSGAAMGRELGRTERGIHHKLSAMRVRKDRVASDIVTVPIVDISALTFSLEPGRLRRLAAAQGLKYDAALKRLHRRKVHVRRVDGLMSELEVVQEYRCSRRRVRRLVREGLLAAKRSGRFLRFEAEDCERVAGLLEARSKHDGRRRAK